MAAQTDEIRHVTLLLTAGVRTKGEYRCSACSYGVSVHSRLPRCPMCGAGSWEQLDWSALGRAAQIAASDSDRVPRV